MRRLFVFATMVLSLGLTASSVWAGNQEEANRIAKRLGEVFPQYGIEVVYQEGNVRLRGDVPSEMERERVLQVVKQLPKVRSVSESFTLTANPYSTAQVAAPYADQTSVMPTSVSPIPTTADPGRFRQVSATRVDEAYIVPQGGMGPNDSFQLAPAPGVPIEVYGNYNYAPHPSVSPAYNGNGGYQGGGQVPMGTVIEGGGQYAGYSNQPTRAPSNSMAPQGTPIGAGQAGQANLPNYAWPTTADYPNYAQVSYPKQYAAGAFPYVGPFYPYPQVPLGWRKVTMEWHDGYWWLDFNDGSTNGPFSPLFRQPNQYR